MRDRILVLSACVVTALGLGVTAVRSQPTTQRADGAPTSRPATEARAANAGRDQRPPNLERSMKAMNRPLHQIAGLIDDPANDARVLQLIADLQVATAQAKSVTPHEFAELPSEEERIKAQTDYRLRMVGILQVELELESAVLNKDRPAVKAAMSKLIAERKEGHDALGVDDDAAKLFNERHLVDDKR